MAVEGGGIEHKSSVVDVVIDVGLSDLSELGGIQDANRLMRNNNDAVRGDVIIFDGEKRSALIFCECGIMCVFELWA